MKEQKYNHYLVRVEYETGDGRRYSRAYIARYNEPDKLKAIMRNAFTTPWALSMTVERGLQVATYERVAYVNGKKPKRGSHDEWVQIHKGFKA